MINFPVAGGTSGHLLGGTLAAMILGSPWAATLAMATVFIIQAVFIRRWWNYCAGCKYYEHGAGWDLGRLGLNSNLTSTVWGFVKNAYP